MDKPDELCKLKSDAGVHLAGFCDPKDCIFCFSNKLGPVFEERGIDPTLSGQFDVMLSGKWRSFDILDGGPLEPPSLL